MATKIVVDAGHGGYDNGASYLDRREKEDNLRLALAVGAILEENGYDVSFNRTTDIYQSPLRKAQLANEAGADFFVSIHRNSSPEAGTYQGIQTLIYNPGGLKEDVANTINAEVEKLGFRNLGISIRPNLTVLKRTNMPAVLVEAGFINSDIDNQLFDERFDELAQAIARGIIETLEETTTPDTGPDDYQQPTYRIQVGLYKNYSNALNQLSRVEEYGYEANIFTRGEYYAVQVGNYEDLQNASNIAKTLRSQGFETLIVTSWE